MHLFKRLSFAGILAFIIFSSPGMVTPSSAAAMPGIAPGIDSSVDQNSMLENVHRKKYYWWKKGKHLGHKQNYLRYKKSHWRYKRRHHRRYRRHRPRFYFRFGRYYPYYYDRYYDDDYYYRSSCGTYEEKKRCARKFRSFNWDTCRYTTYSGRKRLCPYIR